MEFIEELEKDAYDKLNGATPVKSYFDNGEKLCEELGIDYYDLDYDKLENDQRLQSVWMMSWVCTDTTVGMMAFFLDGILIAYTMKCCRKCETKVFFESDEEARKLSNFFRDHIREDSRSGYPLFKDITQEDLNNIADSYSQNDLYRRY